MNVRIVPLCVHYHHLQADYGGLVSPSGLSYVGHSHEQLGEIPAAAACKRMVLDEALAKAAVRQVCIGISETNPYLYIYGSLNCM